MAQNLQMDPMKRDYVLKDGSPIPSDRSEEAVYFALLIPQGKWLYGNPNQGSLLYLLQNSKRTNAVEQSFASYASDAVKRQVLSAGIVKDVKVTNLAASRSGTSNEIAVIPNNSRQAEDLTFISVG